MSTRIDVAWCVVLWTFAIIMWSILGGLVGAVATIGIAILTMLSFIANALIDIGEKMDEHKEERS